jgi:hypothetical protein
MQILPTCTLTLPGTAVPVYRYWYTAVRMYLVECTVQYSKRIISPDTVVYYTNLARYCTVVLPVPGIALTLIDAYGAQLMACGGMTGGHWTKRHDKCKDFLYDLMKWAGMSPNPKSCESGTDAARFV